MTQREIIMQREYGIAPDSEVCGNCKHFIQHYIFNFFTHPERFSPMHCGHCTYPRMKNRTVHDTCDKFEAVPKGADVDCAGGLNPEEREFLEEYRKLPENAQRAVIGFLAASVRAMEPSGKCKVIPMPVKAPKSGTEQK